MKKDNHLRHARKIKRENIALKKTVRRLRRIIDGFDIDRFDPRFIEEEEPCQHDHHTITQTRSGGVIKSGANRRMHILSYFG